MWEENVGRPRRWTPRAWPREEEHECWLPCSFDEKQRRRERSRKRQKRKSNLFPPPASLLPPSPISLSCKMSQSSSLRNLPPVPPPSAKKADAYQEIEEQVERDIAEYDQARKTLKEVAEAEEQLSEIKKDALAVINKFNKKDAEGEEEEEEEVEEDSQSSNNESYIRPIRWVDEDMIPFLAEYCAASMHGKKIKKPMGAPFKYAASYKGFKPFFEGGYYVTNLELIPERKRYLIVNIVKYNPLSDADFARWYAKKTEE